MSEPVEKLEEAMARSGIADGKVLKIRHQNNYYITATESEKIADDEPQGPTLLDENPLKSCDVTALGSKPSGRVVCLRTPNNADNRFVYVHKREEDCELQLRIGTVDPRTEGVGLFSRTKKFCIATRDFVYTYTNIKYNKCIAVLLHPTHRVTLTDPPDSPAKSGPSSTEFEEEINPSRPDNILLKPTVYKIKLAYNDKGVDGPITLSEEGSPLTVWDETPVHAPEKDGTYRLWNLPHPETSRPESPLASDNNTT